MASWLVWCPGRGEGREEARLQRGIDTPEQAAADWARWSDSFSGDYEIARFAGAIEVLVAPAGGSADPVRVEVSVEIRPRYSARMVL